MTELKRWVESGAPDGVRELLVAAREERPESGGSERTLVALGVGSAVVTGASHASGAAGLASAAGATKSAVSAGTFAMAVKWGIIGAVSAVATAGAVHVVLKERASSGQIAARAQVVSETPSPKPAPVARPAVVTAAATAAPVASDEAEPTTVKSGPEVAPTKSPGSGAEVAAALPAPSRDESPQMLEEIRAIDGARSALARGDAMACLSAVASYESTWKERRFQPEALYLRMEALGQLGDVVGERATATELLSSFPRAPQAARAKVVLTSLH